MAEIITSSNVSQTYRIDTASDLGDLTTLFGQGKISNGMYSRANTNYQNGITTIVKPPDDSNGLTGGGGATGGSSGSSGSNDRDSGSGGSSGSSGGSDSGSSSNDRDSGSNGQQDQGGLTDEQLEDVRDEVENLPIGENRVVQDPEPGGNNAAGEPRANEPSTTDTSGSTSSGSASDELIAGVSTPVALGAAALVAIVVMGADL